MNPTLKRLIHNYLLPYRRQLVFAVLAMIVVAATTAALAWMMQPVLDNIFVAKDKEMLWVVPLGIVGVSLVKAVAAYQQSMLMRFLGQRIISDLQLELYNHLMHADMALFHRESSGSLISRFTNDVILLREASSNVLTSVAREVLSLVFLIAVMFYQNVELALIATVIFPLAILPIGRLGRRMRKVTRNTQAELGQFTRHLDESFQGIRIIKAYGQEEAETTRAKLSIERVFTQYIKTFRIKSIASPVMELLSGISIAMVIGYGGWQVIEGHTTAGAFFSFVTAMMLAYKPLKSLAGLNANLQEGIGAAERVFAMLDIAPEIQSVEGAPALKIDKGAIAFEDIRFAYTPEKPALLGVSLEVPAGKTVALVGASGSGKSTLTHLLLRFYDAQSGCITIDGQDITKVDMHSLRQSMALVTQETILFDESVRANLTYGQVDVAEEVMIQAAKDAEAHEFIIALPQGYDTPIGQHGVTLSGGQRQRLAIARAMIKNAPILLLDEATSALDPVSEQKIQTALTRLMKGRTSLVIAHRLSTIIDADIIYVMRAGKVVESGRHAELLAKGGEYAALYASQQG
jgi:subfamily B ATP-binding cassette protein MsbA